MTQNLATRLKQLRQNATFSIHHLAKATPGVLSSCGQSCELRSCFSGFRCKYSTNKDEGKTPTASLPAINSQTQQSQQQLLYWRTTLLALNFFPSFHPDQTTGLSPIHTESNPSLHSESFLAPHLPQPRTAFPQDTNSAGL